MTDTTTRFMKAWKHIHTLSPELAEEVAEKTSRWSNADKDLLSLGGGRAVACNNTDQAPERNADGSAVRHPPLPGKARGIPKETNLTYEGNGSATYGVFQMAELCDILNRTSKYMVGTLNKETDEYVESNSPTGCNIVVRHVDPTNPGLLDGRTWY